jgi:hypothetical protein
MASRSMAWFSAWRTLRFFSIGKVELSCAFICRNTIRIVRPLTTCRFGTTLT